MKLQMDSGNFSAQIEGEVDMDNSEVVASVLDAGLRYIGEREGLGEVYKKLGGKVNDKGKVALPKEFKRTDVEFNTNNAAVFAATLETVLGKLGVFEVKVTQYVAPETDGGLKKATALFEAAKAKGVLDGLAEALKYTEDVANAEAFIAHIHAVKYAKKAAASELDEMGL